MKLNPRLFQEARHFPLAIIFSIGLSLTGGIMVILQARQISMVINQVFLEHKSLASVSFLLATTLIIIVLQAGFSWAGEASASLVGRRIKQDLRHRLFTHLLDCGPAYLKNEAGETDAHTGELVTTATEGLDALEIYFTQYLPQIALAALIPLAILIFVFPIDYLSGLIFLLTAPLLPLFMYLIGSAAEALTRRQWQGLSRMSAYFLDVLQGLTTLKSLGRSREQIEVIKRVSENYRQSTMSVLRVTFLSALVLELIATLSIAVVAVEIGIRLLYGRLLFEQAFFLLLLAPEFYRPLRLLGVRFHAGMAGVEAARRVYEILDLPTNTSDPAQAPSSTSPNLAPAISIRNVSFAYVTGHQALKNVSFEIPAGKVTALTGKSGAGKTTLTWLLLRFLQPQSGQVMLGGSPLDHIPASQWLEMLSWVPQNPYLFNDTILANIKLARPAADDVAIQAAARLAHADGFIQAMPMGYQTQIGERGLRLSAGQAQRIALARAFLKDAPFLILDEATSHLDPELNVLMRDSLRQLCRGRTVLVIAHQQNTLDLAHQVVRLDHGEVQQISEGKHEAVLDLRASDTHVQRVNPQQTIVGPLGTGENNQKEARYLPEEAVEKRLLKLLLPFSKRILLSVLLGFATIASGIGLMATAAYIISAAALHPSIAELQVAIVGVRFFGLSRGVFRYLERLVSHDTTLRLLARWRTWFYQALEPLAPGRLMEYHSADLLSRVISDIGSLENFYVRSIAPPMVAILVGVITSLFMASFGAQLAWGLVAFLVMAGVGLPALALVLSHKVGPEILVERARLSTLLLDGIQGMADLLTCGQAAAYKENVHQAGENLSWQQTRMAVLTSLLNSLSSLLANLGMLCVLVLAIQRVSAGRLDGVLLGVVALTALTCFEAMQPMPLAAQSYETNLAAASRLYKLVDASPLVKDPEKRRSLLPYAGLEVRQLSFQYPEVLNIAPGIILPPFSLKDISFSLPHGKHIALIGESGAGKTTLINLLLRFWEYPAGSILFDGNELRQYCQDDVRQSISTISQNTYLFSATIKENLLIARPQATDTEIIRATQQAQLHDFIISLPDGYNTWIGEHGLRLSAGERQRLALARALLKDASLLILDEPTANLDPDTELATLAAIREASQAYSSITITQSMTGLESMDEILVLRDGRIIERGSHNQLISKPSVYKNMWDLYHKTI